MAAGEYKIGRKAYQKQWRESKPNVRCLSKEYKSQYALEWHRKNPEKYLLKSAKRRAERDKKEFKLTVDDIKIPEFCPVLKIKLTEVRSRSDAAPSIDRIDNSKGYTKDNIAVISTKANSYKSDMTLEQIGNLYKYALSTFT